MNRVPETARRIWNRFWAEFARGPERQESTSNRTIAVLIVGTWWLLVILMLGLTFARC